MPSLYWHSICHETLFKDCFKFIQRWEEQAFKRVKNRKGSLMSSVSSALLEKGSLSRQLRSASLHLCVITWLIVCREGQHTSSHQHQRRQNLQINPNKQRARRLSLSAFLPCHTVWRIKCGLRWMQTTVGYIFKCVHFSRNTMTGSLQRLHIDHEVMLAERK